MFQNADSYIVFSPENRLYFSGFKASYGCVVVTPNFKRLFTDLRYVAEAKLSAVGCEVVAASGAGLYEAAAQTLSEAGAQTVGFEDDYVTVADYDKLKDALSAFALVPAARELGAARAIKRDDEISKIATAEAITQRAFLKTLPLIKTGVTEKEISDELAYQMLRHGAQELAFESIVAFGANTAVPHHHPTTKKLEKNELVTVDMGARVDGYCGDMTRTFCLGTPCEELVKIHRLVLEAQEYALTNLREGLTARAAHVLAAEYIAANGYGKAFLHSLGHGIGLNVHESPYLGAKSEDVLTCGNVFSIEPGIYVDGLGGVRIEDLVAITSDGVVNLTTNVSKNLNL